MYEPTFVHIEIFTFVEAYLYIYGELNLDMYVNKM